MDIIIIGILAIIIIILALEIHDKNGDLEKCKYREGVTQKTLTAITKNYARVQELINNPRKIIQLSPSEIQSNSSRVRQAEGLIAQLPETHGGRNSWIMNYGTGDETKRRRAKFEQSSIHEEFTWPTVLK